MAEGPWLDLMQRGGRERSRKPLDADPRTAGTSRRHGFGALILSQFHSGAQRHPPTFAVGPLEVKWRRDNTSIGSVPPEDALEATPPGPWGQMIAPSSATYQHEHRQVPRTYRGRRPPVAPGRPGPHHSPVGRYLSFPLPGAAIGRWGGVTFVTSTRYRPTLEGGTAVPYHSVRQPSRANAPRWSGHEPAWHARPVTDRPREGRTARPTP